MNAWAAGLLLNMTTVSPPRTTEGGEPLIEGNGNWLYPVIAFALTVATPGTKSPSITIAALGGLEKTALTESGKPAWRAPDVPPAILRVSVKIWLISLSAFFTDGSVHLI